MRLAAFYAGLILNAEFLRLAAGYQWYWGDPVSFLLGPLLWGLVLLFGVYAVPARSGLGPREIVEAQLGPWAGAFVWRVLLPLWAVSWFYALTGTFTYTVHAPFFRWEEIMRQTVDTKIAVYWPWILLCGLAGLAPVERVSFPVKVTGAILLAAPFAWRDEWPEAARAFSRGSCCTGIWAMQDVMLWLAPALLYAGRFPERRLWHGLLGITLPILAAMTVAFGTLTGGANSSNLIAKTGDYLGAVAGPGKEGTIKMMLLSLTMLAAGRFCIALLSEHLGEWRRWWVVLPLTAALAWNVLHYWPDRLAWQLTATPFIALAGVLCSGYLHNRQLQFTKGEQRLATSAWVCGTAVGVTAHLAESNSPLLAWLTGFLVMWAGLRVKSYLNVAVAMPLR